MTLLADPALFLISNDDDGTARVSISLKPQTGELEQAPVVPGSYTRSSVYLVGTSVRLSTDYAEFLGDWHIHLLAVEQPLRFAERLQRQVSTSGALFVSIGIVSIIMISRGLVSSPDQIERYRNLMGSQLHGVEELSLQDGRIVARRLLVMPVPIAYTIPDFSAVRLAQLPHDTHALIDEVITLGREAMAKSARWAPSLLLPVEHTIRESKRCIDELTAACAGADAVTFLRQSRFNDAKSRLIHHCASLSYIVSQGLSCALPIQSSECYFRCHSLFGISQIIQALTALEGDISAKFTAASLELLIVTEYADWVLPGPFLPFGAYELDEKKDLTEAEVTLIDRAAARIASHSEREPAYNRHVCYVSTRHGYKWVNQSVTVPAEVIANSACASWNLLTLTHELLHCHIHSILSTILGKNDQGDDTLWLVDHLVEYNAWRNGQHQPRSIQQGLRYRIFEFAENYSSSSATAQAAATPGVTTSMTIKGFKDAQEGRTRLDKSFRMLNEVLVHTFDLNYFFRRNATAYIRLLWSSWSRVPSVSISLDQYLVRCLVALSTLQKGHESFRFDWALQELTNALDTVEGDPCLLAVKEQILAIFANPLKKKSIQLQFFYCLPLVDDAMKYLFVHRVFSAIDSGGVEQRGGDIYVEPAQMEIPSEISGYPIEISRAFYFSSENVLCGMQQGADIVGVKLLLHLASARKPD